MAWPTCDVTPGRLFNFQIRLLVYTSDWEWATYTPSSWWVRRCRGANIQRGNWKMLKLRCCVCWRERPVCVMRVNDKFFQALKCESLVVVDFFMISAVTAIRTSWQHLLINSRATTKSMKNWIRNPERFKLPVIRVPLPPQSNFIRLE